MDIFRTITLRLGLLLSGSDYFFGFGLLFSGSDYYFRVRTIVV